MEGIAAGQVQDDAACRADQSSADLEEFEAVQVVNCMPETADELRVFLASGRKIIETTKLEAIVSLLNASRAAK